MDDPKILSKLKELIDEGNRLASILSSHTNSYNQHINRNNVALCQMWKGSSLNLLKLRFGIDSDYYIDFFRVINLRFRDAEEYYQENVAQATGVLAYVYDALKNGLTNDLFFKKEIIVMSNLLDQAFDFFNKNLKPAAAIYGRIVLETTIKEFGKLNGVNDANFDQVIINLRQKGLILEPFEISLRANYKIGSWAAHNDEKFQKLSDTEIKEFLNFIRDKVLNIN